MRAQPLCSVHIHTVRALHPVRTLRPLWSKLRISASSIDNETVKLIGHPQLDPASLPVPPPNKANSADD